MRIRHKAIEAIAALVLATPFVACTGETTSDRSALSGEGSGSDDDCTLTQGYWKNHPDAWPVSSLKLGSVTYSKDELLAILKTPVKGNGLIQLAHQLIAAKLNIAAGASASSINGSISDADALIGSLVCPPKGTGSLEPSKTSGLTGKLDAFNSGNVGPGHCGDNGGGGGSDDTCDHDEDGDGQCDTPPPEPVCGNGILEDGEQCDDGNTLPGDGCCDLCEIEVPVCGNGIVEQGEHCDDGNLLNGDGCSSACVCECP